MIAIKKEIIIEASQKHSFKTCCVQMDAWWPRSHHTGKSPMRSMILEAKENGRWYSTHQDGERCDIGYVKTYQPYSKLILVWQLNGSFQYQTDLHTEAEFNFVELEPKKTLVTFEHRNVELLGKAVDGMDKGWGMIIDLFAEISSHGKFSDKSFALFKRENV